MNELTFKEAEISKLYTKVHPGTARCWRNGRRWKTKKPNLMSRNGDAENPAGNCPSDPRCRSGQQVYMQLLNKEQELKITEPAPSAMCALLTRQSPSLACETQERADYPRRDYPRPDALYVGVLLRSLFNRGIESPQVLENTVSASMPASRCRNGRKRA